MVKKREHMEKCGQFGNAKFLVVGILRVLISKARQDAFKHCSCFMCVVSAGLYCL